VSEQHEPEINYYEAMGGEPVFNELVHRFYVNVSNNAVLAPMYPKKDMEGAEKRLRLFLMQYWGGPDTYSQERGHPRLRMRHNGFYIGKVEFDAWLACMHAALIDLDMVEELKEKMWEYFQYAAYSMINQPQTLAPTHSSSATQISESTSVTTQDNREPQ
jgi:hemoglobin